MQATHFVPLESARARTISSEIPATYRVLTEIHRIHWKNLSWDRPFNLTLLKVNPEVLSLAVEDWAYARISRIVSGQDQ